MIRFPLFGVPVGIHLSALFIALFGLGLYRSLVELTAWTVAVLIAVLAHESGHAFTARAFGADNVSITLFALGGYTLWAPGQRPVGPGRRFVISAAGSGVGIALGLVVFALGKAGLYDGAADIVFAFANGFVLAALIWGALNWIPLLPLDGGHMMQSLLEIVWPTRATQVSRGVSLVVGIVLIGVAVWARFYFMALFLVFILATGLRSTTPRVEGDETEPAPTTDPPEFPI